MGQGEDLSTLNLNPSSMMSSSVITEKRVTLNVKDKSSLLSDQKSNEEENNSSISVPVQKPIIKKMVKKVYNLLFSHALCLLVTSLIFVFIPYFTWKAKAAFISWFSLKSIFMIIMIIVGRKTDKTSKRVLHILKFIEYIYLCFIAICTNLEHNFNHTITPELIGFLDYLPLLTIPILHLFISMGTSFTSVVIACIEIDRMMLFELFPEILNQVLISIILFVAFISFDSNLIVVSVFSWIYTGLSFLTFVGIILVGAWYSISEKKGLKGMVSTFFTATLVFCDVLFFTGTILTFNMGKQQIYNVTLSVTYILAILLLVASGIFYVICSSKISQNIEEIFIFLEGKLGVFFGFEYKISPQKHPKIRVKKVNPEYKLQFNFPIYLKKSGDGKFEAPINQDFSLSDMKEIRQNLSECSDSPPNSRGSPNIMRRTSSQQIIRNPLEDELEEVKENDELSSISEFPHDQRVRFNTQNKQEGESPSPVLSRTSVIKFSDVENSQSFRSKPVLEMERLEVKVTNDVPKKELAKGISRSSIQDECMMSTKSRTNIKCKKNSLEERGRIQLIKLNEHQRKISKFSKGIFVSRIEDEENNQVDEENIMNMESKISKTRRKFGGMGLEFPAPLDLLSLPKINIKESMKRSSLRDGKFIKEILQIRIKF